MKSVSIYPRRFLLNAITRRNTGFILVPFSEEYAGVTQAIREAIRHAGLTPQRANDEFLTRAAMEKILRG